MVKKKIKSDAQQQAVTSEGLKEQAVEAKELTTPKASVKVADDQQQAVAGKETKQPKAVASKEASNFSYLSTDGKNIENVKLEPRKGSIFVSIDYGKKNEEGKTAAERRGTLQPLSPRPLTKEQYQKYAELSEKDQRKAYEYAVRSAFPMHYDDKAFNKRDTEINGQHVNYIIVEKLTEDTFLKNSLRKSGVDVDKMKPADLAAVIDGLSPEDKKKALSGKENLIGKYQISFGEKGKSDTRFFGILSKDEVSSIHHRAEVKQNDKGRLVIGAPVTLADIAGRVQQRVYAERQAKEDRMTPVKKVDWAKFKLPEGTNIDKLHYQPVKNNNDRVMLKGELKGVTLSALLSKNETLAVTSKMATLNQVAAANKDFRNQVKTVLGFSDTEKQSNPLHKDNVKDELKDYVDSFRKHPDDIPSVKDVLHPNDSQIDLLPKSLWQLYAHYESLYEDAYTMQHSGLVAPEDKEEIKEKALEAGKTFRDELANALGVREATQAVTSGQAQSQSVSEDDAIKAIVDRASDPSAKSFDKDQSGTILRFLGDIDDDGRDDIVAELWGKAKEQLDDKKVDEAWQKDAHSELKDLAHGIHREEQQSLHR